MANSTKNPRAEASFPGKFNKRENRASTHNYSCAVTDSDLTLTSSDGINYVRNSGANTITLPPASDNKGRTIAFLQADLNTMTIAQNADSANIDGADADFTALDAADDCCDLFCTGTEWIIVRSSIS